MTKYNDLLTPSNTFKRCYESHPPLPIGEFFIYGGSCGYPIVTDADIYVGFDYSMKPGPKSYPWNEGHSFLFHIMDGTAPKDLQEAKKLIDWLALNLSSNLKIHVGCIGGHGRTGTILAALVNVMTGEKDAIEYVRNNYCKKVVESPEQVEWLHKHFGITKAKPSKAHPSEIKSLPKSSSQTVWTNTPSWAAPKKDPLVIEPMKNKASIWGVNAI